VENRCVSPLIARPCSWSGGPPPRPADGRLVRELPVGALIGRRELRAAMGVLRRTPAAATVRRGQLVTGIGGIGKTALAGRVISRLRGDGWLIAVHEGRWTRPPSSA
jgi:hypothetical protein